MRYSHVFSELPCRKHSDSTKRFQENFLRSVRGVRCVSQHAQDQVVDRSVVVRDQPVKGGLGTGLQSVTSSDSSRPQDKPLAQSDTDGLSGSAHRGAREACIGLRVSSARSSSLHG